MGLWGWPDLSRWVTIGRDAVHISMRMSCSTGWLCLYAFMHLWVMIVQVNIRIVLIWIALLWRVSWPSLWVAREGCCLGLCSFCIYWSHSFIALLKYRFILPLGGDTATLLSGDSLFGVIASICWLVMEWMAGRQLPMWRDGSRPGEAALQLPRLMTCPRGGGSAVFLFLAGAEDWLSRVDGALLRIGWAWPNQWGRTAADHKQNSLSQSTAHSTQTDIRWRWTHDWRSCPNMIYRPTTFFYIITNIMSKWDNVIIPILIHNLNP